MRSSQLRRRLKAGLLALGLFTTAMLLTMSSASAQGDAIVHAPAPLPHRRFYEAKGYYGTSFGTPSYKIPRSYSAFSSPWGGGMSYGYPPATILPGWGAELWRPGPKTAIDNYGGGIQSYRTWAYPYNGKNPAGPLPPFGVYAPAYGPGVNGW